MPTLKNKYSSRPASPLAFRHEDMMVAFLMERLRQLPKESFGDIVSLVQEITKPGMSVEEQNEIWETIREILFPDILGDICIGGRTGSVEETPEKLQRRTDHAGGVIKRKREEKDMTQDKLAELTGLPQSRICRLEAGVHSPSFKTLEKIAKALGVTVGVLDPSYDLAE